MQYITLPGTFWKISPIENPSLIAKLSKLIYDKSVHPEKTSVIEVITDKLKFEISTYFKLLHPLNIEFILFVLVVSNFDKFNEINDLQL